MLKLSLSGAKNGPIVVFLHAAGISSWMWRDITPRLPDLTHVLVDLPGHGESNAISWHSIAGSAELIWAELEASISQSEMEKRGIHLVGLSLGSYVGLAMLSLRPEIVSTAVFSGMHAQKMKNAVLLKVLATLMTPFSRLPFMARQTAQMFGLKDEDVNIFVQEARKTRMAAIRKTIAQVIDYIPPDNLSSIRARVLFVAGSKEHEAILSSLTWLATHVQHGQAAVAPGLGHGWAGQDPELFAHMISAHQSGAALPERLQTKYEAT